MPARRGDAMTKQEQFLWAVQTTLLANSIYLIRKPEQIEGKGHIISATGMSNSIRAVLAASERIPANLSAFDAAMELMAADRKETGNGKCHGHADNCARNCVPRAVLGGINTWIGLVKSRVKLRVARAHAFLCLPVETTPVKLSGRRLPARSGRRRPALRRSIGMNGIPIRLITSKLQGDP